MFGLSFYLDDSVSGADAIRPASVPTGERVPGPAAPFPDGATIRPASIPTGEVVPGPAPVPNPVTLRPIAPASIETGERVPGPWVVPAPPTDPTVPTMPAGPTRVQSGIEIVGYPLATSKQATPAVNGTGGGSFTVVPPGPEPDEIVGVNVSGRRVFTGLASRITTTTVADGEEAAELVQVELDGLLAEWAEAVVLPDFGASDVTRLGPPTQDSRVFDWTMNGLGNESFGEAGVNVLPSQSIDATQAALEGIFQLPDVWPDPTARIMWANNPRVPAPRGWCHFRVPTSRYRGTLQLWACAYDYAEVWVDGVPMATCDQPGVAQHVTFESRYDYHLLAVRAYNRSGRAGVMLSLLPVHDDGLYGEPVMNSRSNWKSIAYPTRTFISTPGQVLHRLRDEAMRRGLWPSSGPGSWQLDFGNLTDSAGRPWPRPTPITLEVGMTYLDVLMRLADDRLDFAASPAQRRIRAYVKDRGTGRTAATPWTEGVDLLGESVKEQVR